MAKPRQGDLEGEYDDNGQLLPMRVEELPSYWSIKVNTPDGRWTWKSPQELMPEDDVDYDCPVTAFCGRCGEADMDMWCSNHHDDSHVDVYLPKHFRREKKQTP